MYVLYHNSAKMLCVQV